MLKLNKKNLIIVALVILLLKNKKIDIQIEDGKGRKANRLCYKS